MFLEKFTDIEKEIFLKKFMFFAVQKEPTKSVREKSPARQIIREEKNIPFTRSMMHDTEFSKSMMHDDAIEVPVPIHRNFPQTERRYIIPPKQHRIAASMPMESSIINQEKFTSDVSEKIPERKQIIEERSLVMSEDEMSVPVPKRFEGRREPQKIRLGERQIMQNQPQDTAMFGKISPFVNDQSIVSIEVASGENVKISRGREKISTNVTLNDSEVKQLIEEFSKKTRIPLSEFFKAQYGDWQINGILSEIISPRFMLTKERDFNEIGMQTKKAMAYAFEPSAKIEESQEIVSQSKQKVEEKKEEKIEQKVQENQAIKKTEENPKKRLFQHLPETNEIPEPS